jgi:actin-related protein
MTEEQRMQEGRRMFQIFAARMFEQRVLSAYREKVAAERQQKLLEELEEEKGHDAAREAKKAKDAEKRKQKKQAQKQKQAEEKAKKDAEKAAQEAAVKEAETKRQEELKKKRDEQRLKKEEQRKTQEAELARKNAEKLKRQKEEQDRRQETERKIREQKEAEKKAKEEAKKKEREEREAKERKSKTDKERKEREARDRSEKEAQARKEALQANAVQQAAQAAKRAAAPVVPLPPGLHKQTSNFGSPHIAVATPVIPKAPTPSVRQRQGSQQTSKGSSPKTPAVAIGQKATSPSSNAPHQNGPIAPRTILSRPPSQPPGSAPQQSMNHMHIAPPPGMGMPQGPPFGMPPGMNGFHHQGPMMPGMRTPMQNVPHMFSPQQPPIGGQFRPFMPNGMPGPPPGMGGPGMPSFGQGPPGFPPQMNGAPPGFGGPIQPMPDHHSRNQSGSSTVEAPIGPPSGQAIHRPTPIQRPSSVKPYEQDRSSRADIDELSNHLGSSALLDDDESPEPLYQDRRPTMAPGLGRAPSNLSSAFGMPGLFTNINNQPQMNGFGAPGSNPSSSWSTPSLQGFQQSNLSSANGWGSSPTSGWPSSNGLSFGNNMQQVGRPRLLQIRINMCDACKALTNANKNSTDGFHDARTVFAQARERVQPPAPEEEMLMLLDTEGTAQNGGGSFQLKKLGTGSMDMLVKWTPDAGDGQSQTRIGSIGVGEIGSPLLGASNPGSANVTPFGSLRGFPNLSGLGTGL